MADRDFELNIAYRMAYGIAAKAVERCRSRLEWNEAVWRDEAERAMAAEGLDKEPDPESMEALREGFKDALALRRPRW